MTGVGHLVAGRYRIIGPLGEGGMGRVWLALDEALDRQVAIKKCSVPDGLTEAEQTLLRDWTAREAQAVARVLHPNVVRIHDVLTDDDLPWIVMEYVPARSLLQVIKEDGALPAGQVARIGLEVLHALNAVGEVGILHLDVKPSNVLMADDGRVMLTDFGPAVTAAGIEALDRAGLVLGSPNYVAPERLLHGASTAEVDLWSLGATLYHAVEGRPPYARGTAAATLGALGSGAAPDPALLAGPLVPVLDGLLQRAPADRLAAAKTEEHLRELADPEPYERPRPVEGPAAPGEPAPGRSDPADETVVVLRPRSRGRRVAVLVTLSVLLALLALMAADRFPFSGGGERPGTAAGAPGPSPTSRAAAPSPAPYVLPPGYKWWNDRNGFRVAVPTGWPNGRSVRNGVAFTAPGGRVSLKVSSWTPKGGNAVAALVALERDVTLASYRRIKIEPLSTPPDAVWEYTFRDSEDGLIRTLQRVVARGGRTYLIEWRTPAQNWGNELQKLDVVVDSLRPLAGA